MPEFEVDDRFWNDFARLSPEERQQFLAAKDAFIAALRTWEDSGMHALPVFPKKLGVTRMVGRPGIMELAWAPDGRATWKYGLPSNPRKCRIVWRRIGTHAIYDEP